MFLVHTLVESIHALVGRNASNMSKVFRDGATALYRETFVPQVGSKVGL